MSRGQMSRGQMSLAVKCPAVKCQLRSDVITPLRGQMSLAVYCPAVKRPRSNVPWSNETVVIGDPIILGSYHDNLLMKNEN